MGFLQIVVMRAIFRTGGNVLHSKNLFTISDGWNQRRDHLVQKPCWKRIKSEGFSWRCPYDFLNVFYGTMMLYILVYTTILNDCIKRYGFHKTTLKIVVLKL